MSRALSVVFLAISVVAACSGTNGPTPVPNDSMQITTPQPASSSAASSEPTARPPQTPAASGGAQRTDAKGIAQVLVPAGTFQMGTDATDPTGELAPPDWAHNELPAERPQHEVSISKDYWIDTTEVTNAAFQAFVDGGGYTTLSLWSDTGRDWLAKQDVSTLPLACESAEPKNPRVCVTWYEAEAYAAWRGGSLPTEAQWEFAARGPESKIYPWGDEWDETRANIVDSEGPSAVGSYPDGVSWVGAHDLSGNAMEWTRDW